MSLEKRFEKHNEKAMEFGRRGCAYVHAETENGKCALVLGGDGIELLFVCVRLIDRLSVSSDVTFEDTCDLLIDMYNTYEEVKSDD